MAKLGLPVITDAMANKTVGIANALAAIENKLTGLLELALTGDLSLSAANAQGKWIIYVTPNADGHTITMPDLTLGLMLVNVSDTYTFDVEAGATVATVDAEAVVQVMTVEGGNGKITPMGGGGGGVGLPTGGTDGQVLKKQSGTDFDVAWEDDATGGGGGGGGAGLFPAFQTNMIDGTGSSQAGNTLRVVIKKEHLTKTGTKLRFRFQAFDTVGATIANAYVGRKGAGSYDFAATPTRITFGGSNGATLLAGEMVISDAINFTMDGTVDIVVAVDCPAGTTEFASRLTNPGVVSYFKAGADSSTVAATGYSTSSRSTVGLNAIWVDETSTGIVGWENAFNAQLVGTSSNWSGYTIRTRISAAELRVLTTTSKVRLGFTFASSGTLSGAYFGIKGANDVSFAATPTQLLFEGATSKAYAGGGMEILSDELVFAFGAADDLLVAFRCTGSGQIRDGDPAGTGISSSYKNATDESTQTGTGYTFHGNKLVGLTRFQIQ
jgi:hypothetical protein